MADQPTIHATRVPTGIPGLDELLGGGWLPARTILIKGAAGSGKTTLGLQYLVAGALEYEEPGILITFEQMPAQLYADAARLGWDLRAMNEQGWVRVVFVRPDELLDQPGRQANRLLVNIADWAEEEGARRVMIDSISHLRPLFAADEARTQFMKFLLQLKAMELTPLMIAEMTPGEDLTGLDAYLVDTLVRLHHEAEAGPAGGRRSLEIIKTRGYGHVGGRHPFEIGTGGLRVFSRTESDGEAETAATPRASTLATGVAGLDPLLGGGYTPGSVILVAGLSGTFKTALAGHFLTAGAEAGEPGLWVTFQESAAQLEQDFAARGLNLTAARESGGLRFMERAPGEASIEQLIHEIEDAAAEHGARRIAIDGIRELTLGHATADDSVVSWARRRLAATGATVLLTRQLTRVTGRNPLSEIERAELADTIIYLGLVEIESRLEKVVSVIKHRGGPIAGDLRSIVCAPDGLRVSERFIGMSGVLEGAPLGQRKARIEELFQPLFFIRDFLTLARDPKLQTERRDGMLQNLSGETQRVIDLLAGYFDQPELRSPPPAAGNSLPLAGGPGGELPGGEDGKP